MHFLLQDIIVPVHIGITTEERESPQSLVFRVSFTADSTIPAQTDDIADTVDYQIIYDTIKNLAGSGEWNLLEKLHHELLLELQKNCPKANDLTLAITKAPWEDATVTVR
jgi:FolB domain-containing protein